MKLSKILTGILLFVASVGLAQSNQQDSLIQYYNKYPQQALQEAANMYKKAVKEHNNPLLIKALILKTTFSLQMNQDEFPQLLKDLETSITQEKDINVKSILHSYAGQLYNQYYNRNRYKINQRAELTGPAPENIETWSENLFNEKIFTHLLASIAPATTLQQTPVANYRPILIEGAASDSLRPTLYDFLCHRAIDLLQKDYYQRNSEDVSFPASILGNTNIFLQTPITIIPLNASSNILKIWQHLLAFRKQAGNTNALLMADLERLDYARQISQGDRKDSIYLSTLRGMREEYKTTPMVVEVMAKEADLLTHNYFPNNVLNNLLRSSQKENKAEKEEALAICEEGIRMYPQYNRINQLRELIEKIKAPEITTEFPKTIYPGEKLPVKINSQNISSIEVALYRIQMNITDYLYQKDKNGGIISKTQIYQRNIRLVSDIIYRDTTLQLEVPQTGLYEVEFRMKGAKQNLSDHFISTQIFTTHSRNDKEIQIKAYDWQSGKPIEKAKVYFYKYNHREYTVIDSVYTNVQGMVAWQPANNSDLLFYQVINSHNPTGYVESIYRSQTPDLSESPTELITDRKIYRPGQTVYFKGISWRATADTVYAQNKKLYTVFFYDANYKEIAKQKFISNSFGSFAGSFVIPQQTLNGNFIISCNNWRTSIVVADYKRPEFEITFSEPQQTYYTGDTVFVKGKVNSFSGVAIANTPIHYEFSAFSFFYRLADPRNKTQGITHTNTNGEFEIQFIAQAPESVFLRMRPYLYQLTATLTDAKGETQQASTSIPIFTGKAQPTITIPEQVNKNQETAFRISLDDLPAEANARMVNYTLAKLVSPSSLTQPQDTTIEKIVLQGQLKIQQSDSLIPNLKSLASGAYLFTVECDQTKKTQIFYLYSPNDKRPPIPTYEWLVKEKTNCLVGESAKIQFGTSVKNAYVRYEIYSLNKLLKQKDVVLTDEIINIDIPFLEKYGNQIWVYITYVKDKKYIQEIIPIQRIRNERILTVETKVFRDKLQPGQEEQWEIHVTGYKGQPAMAEILAMMYDASLDKLSPYQLSFNAGYLYPGFRHDRSVPYNFNSNNYQNLFAWGFKQQNFKVPAFRFDRLNLFEQIYNAEESAELSSFGDYSSDSGIQVRGLGANKMVVTGIYSKSKAVAMDQTQALPQIDLRQDFQETAFFYPQLQTDSAGNATIHFKVPESLTRWKFIALTTTKDMAHHMIERYITTSKPIMVRPNLPRFLRSGDQTEIKVTISNLSDSLQQGLSTLEFFKAGSNEVIFSHNVNFHILAGQNQTVSFPFRVPENTDLLGCRIIARSEHFSDGEQNLLPVLPNETLITETLPIYTTDAGAHSFSLQNNSASRKDYRLTLELTTNPIWYAVLALPNLTEVSTPNVTHIASAYYVNTIASKIVRSNPKIAEAIRNWNASKNDPTLLSKLEQNSELKSILLEASPWVMQAQTETERMQSLAQLFDQNRLNYLQQDALAKLADLQTSDGGWSWFKGMYSSRFMTANVLTIMARATTTGEQQYGEKEKMMQIKALRYLDSEIARDFKSSPKRISYDQIIYLYTRSLYRDIPLGDALQAHKYFMTLAQKQWSAFSLYEKAIISIAMFNYGLTQDAKEVLKSLREYAVISPEYGMYWPNNRNEFNRNSAVQIHTAMIEAFLAIEGNNKNLDLMKQWLLRQKQVQSWVSVPATVDAIYALLLTGSDQLNQQDQLTVKIGKHELTTPTTSNPLGYIKESFAAGEIQKDMLTVNINKQKDSPTWGGLYLQYFEKLDQVKGQKTDIGIDKKLYRVQVGKNGQQELVPLTEQTLKVGDKVMTRLTLTVNRDIEFLHLKDLRAACFEPIEQLSGNHWQFGSVYYQEVKDAVTNFFFNSLSRGTYVIEYAVWVNQAGSYQDGIATFQSLYAPEINSFSDAKRIEVEK